MAQKVVVELIDDLDGNPDPERVGRNHRLRRRRRHLHHRPWSQERQSIPQISRHTYISHATRTGGRRHRRSAAASGRPRRDTSETRAVREWALANGYEISARGRIPADIEHACHEAN